MEKFLKNQKKEKSVGLRSP